MSTDMTNRPWLALDPDESIVWSGHPRLHVILWAAVPALALPIVLALVWDLVLGAMLGTVAWAVIASLAYVVVTNIAYVVSTKYVYAKWGIYGRSVTQIALRNIQDTTLKQGIFGTRAGYGTVAFSTAGGDGTTMAFYVVDSPKVAKQAVDQQLAREQHGDAGGEPVSVDTLIDAFRSTRNTAERIARGMDQ